MFSAKNRQIFISKFSKHHYFAYSPNNHDRQYIKRSPIKAIKSKTQPNQNNRKQKPKFPTGWHYCATAKGRGSPPTTTKKPTTIDKIRTKTSKSEQKLPNQNKNFQNKTRIFKSKQDFSNRINSASTPKNIFLHILNFMATFTHISIAIRFKPIIITQTTNEEIRHHRPL